MGKRQRRRLREATAGALVLTLADGESRACTPCTFGGDRPGYVCAFCEYPFAGTTCPNPACLTGMSAEKLASYKEQVAAHDLAAERAFVVQASLERSRVESREAEQARYNTVMAQCDSEGRCRACAARSLRVGGQLKLVKHKDPSNCPEARRHATA